MGTLYVVSTPMGNLQGISLETLRVLKEVSLIAVYDTRHIRKLLNHFGISTPLTSCHLHSAPSCIEDLLEALRQGDVAVVTDAGTSGHSDPTGELVAATLEAGFPVSAVPGASAVPEPQEAAGQAARQATRPAATQMRADRREAYNRLFRSRIVDDEY